MKFPLYLSSPHSGVLLHRAANWLEGIHPPVLLRDLDLFVDELYAPLERHGFELLRATHSRYVCDLNRWTEDIDQGSVIDAALPKGTHPRGLLWQETTRGEVLMRGPISREIFDRIVQEVFLPFHNELKSSLDRYRQKFGRVYHLDLHSMPSRGAKGHSDAGRARAEIVLGNRFGASASSDFCMQIEQNMKAQGFQVVWNDPYKGGRITETYGRPDQGQETVQIELRRDLYMDEETFQKRPEFADVSKRLTEALLQVATWTALNCSPV